MSREAHRTRQTAAYRRWAGAIMIAVALALLPSGVLAEDDSISQRLGQDEFDLQGRSNIVIGAGARGLGMGGAFLARADDATAVSWNPAGLSYLRLPEISLAGARNGFNTSRAGEHSSSHGTALDFAAATFPFEVNGLTGSMQVSFQRIIPFAGTRTIDRERGATRLKASGGFDVVSLATGWRISRRLRMGVTLNRWMNGFNQSLERPLTENKYSRQQVDFSLRGYNAHVGAIVSPVDRLNLGAVVKTRFTGDVRLVKQRQDYFGSILEPSAATSNVLDTSNVRLDFPAAWGIGVSWRVKSSLTISTDYTRTFWSKAWIRKFATLESTLPSAPPPAPEVFERLPYPMLISSQADTSQIRFGVEYVIVSPRIQVPLRAGYMSDRQFFLAQGRAPRFSCYTAGTGVIIGPVAMDVAFLYENGRYSESIGTSSSITARRIFFSLIYRHTACP